MESESGLKTIQSVERAFEILFSFTPDSPRWRVSELSETLGLHLSTTSRLLTTMKKLDVVKKDPVTREYELSFRVLELGRVVLGQLDLVKIAMPLMTELVERCQESAFLTILDGTESVTVAQVAAPRVLSAPGLYHVGRRYQAHAVSGGRLLLAYAPRRTVDELIDEGLQAYTDRTITSPEKLLAELEQVRQQGYAITDQELEIGLFAVALPIRDREGIAIAAVIISGPPERLSNERLPGIIGSVRETAEQISRAMGWPG